MLTDLPPDPPGLDVSAAAHASSDGVHLEHATCERDLLDVALDVHLRTEHDQGHPPAQEDLL